VSIRFIFFLLCTNHLTEGLRQVNVAASLIEHQTVEVTFTGSFSCRIFQRTALLTVLMASLHGAPLASAHQSFTNPGAPASANIAPLQKPSSCRIIYLGFVGALETSGNKRSGIVQIRDILQTKEYSDVCARSFSPYSWTDGRDWLLHYFPSHDGPLTPEELQQAPKVILVGHSMGGWAMLSVARDLRSREIPVELTIQVDSVGITDHTIPRNVKAAAIFHANDVLILMTTKSVKCEDPNYTKMVADIRVARAGHESITRDPRIRELVMDMVASLRIAFAAKPTVAAQPVTELTRGVAQE
jgi:pimeloyl-ACP methyl ester carboxylesterase